MAFRNEDVQISSMSFDSFDPEAMQSAVQRSSLSHVQISGDRFRGRLFNAVHRDCRFAWGHYNVPLMAEGPLAHDRPTMCIVLDGQGDAVFNRQRVGRERLLFFGESTELCTVLPAGCSWISFQIEREELGSLGIDGLMSGFGSDPLPASSGLQVRSSILRALSEIETPTASDPFIAGRLAGLEDMLLSTIAASKRSKHTVYQKNPRKRRTSDRSVAQQVAEYMRCHLGDEQLRIMDVCQRLGQPIKNVERSFIKTYNMTPKRYLTWQRLTMLRRKILSGEAEERNLTDLYLDCGLAHYGRVAGHYHALFGERPSET